jgi:hypothetical protein
MCIQFGLARCGCRLLPKQPQDPNVGRDHQGWVLAQRKAMRFDRSGPPVVEAGSARDRRTLWFLETPRGLPARLIPVRVRTSGAWSGRNEDNLLSACNSSNGGEHFGSTGSTRVVMARNGWRAGAVWLRLLAVRIKGELEGCRVCFFDILQTRHHSCFLGVSPQNLNRTAMASSETIQTDFRRSLLLVPWHSGCLCKEHVSVLTLGSAIAIIGTSIVSNREFSDAFLRDVACRPHDYDVFA